MRSLVGSLVGLIAVLVAAGDSLAESPARFRRDLVRVENGKFLYDDLAVCEFRFPQTEPRKFQTRHRAEAPSQGVVSRDQFVALITQYEFIFTSGLAPARLGLTPLQAVMALHCSRLRRRLGPPTWSCRRR